jgi:hypothetical protein
MKLSVKRPQKKAAKSGPFTKQDFGRLLRKAIHRQEPKRDPE